MAADQRIATAHESLSELIHAIDPRVLIGIVSLAAGIPADERLEIRDRDPRIQVANHGRKASTLVADLVYTGEHGDEVLEIWIIELQLSWCWLKVRRWAIYEIALENEYDAGACLAVVCPDPRLRERIRTKLLPRMKTAPVLIGPEHIERITEFDRARGDPELTILGALFHAHPPAPFDERVAVFQAAWMAIQSLADLRAQRYPVVIMSIIAPEVVEQGIAGLRESGDLDEQRWEVFSDIERNGHSFWRGREEGRAEGREEGREAGRREVLRQSLIDVLELRGCVITQPQRDQIANCESLEILERGYTLAKTSPREALDIDRLLS